MGESLLNGQKPLKNRKSIGASIKYVPAKKRGGGGGSHQKRTPYIKREAINTHRTDVTENCGKLTNVNNSHTRNRCHRDCGKSTNVNTE